MVQEEANQKGKGKAIVKEPMKISSTFVPALNQPLPRADRLFLMPQSSAPQKLKGKKEGLYPTYPKEEEEVNSYDIRRDKGPRSRQIEEREPQNHHPYSYKDQKSLLEAMAADFLSEQKTISGFLGLGTSSGRTTLNPAPHPNLRNHIMEQGKPITAPSQASSSSSCDNLDIELRLGFE
ncbi:hypothetical protein PVK06_031597 [Gossypium arboreum]|uniref:Uncharacterized protein n=1 Tax=Gossypium arboreum TaxID=29729 RepID=A0ABR0NUQ6_GOSAR|nr:hypothetical protein PVK06_031597 [Gossypium arboreum]